jgi:uncharacterized protein (TIGR00255 family)
VARGKVDVNVTRSNVGTKAVSVEPNLALAKAYVDAWKRLQDGLGLTGTIDVSLLAARPDLVQVGEVRSVAKDEIELVRAALDEAMATFCRDREREGKALGKDMRARVKTLAGLRRQIAKRAGQLKPVLAARLRERVNALLEGAEVGAERIAQEVAFQAERSDVTEELVRLDSHLKALADLLRPAEEPIGKRIDFLLQEVHREFNTIASKSADLEVTNATLEARSQIEKLREQTQNLE